MSGEIYRARIRQGDTLVWLARPGTLNEGDPIDANWDCKAGVFTRDGVPLIPAAVFTDKYTDADGNEHFIVAFASSDTTPLPLGESVLVIELANENSVPSYEQETHVQLTVDAQFIP